MITDRLQWTITNKGNYWYAYSDDWEITLVARTKADLMSKINKWEKAND